MTLLVQTSMKDFLKEYNFSSNRNVISKLVEGWLRDVFCRLTVSLKVGPIPCT